MTRAGPRQASSAWQYYITLVTITRINSVQDFLLNLTLKASPATSKSIGTFFQFFLSFPIHLHYSIAHLYIRRNSVFYFVNTETYDLRRNKEVKKHLKFYIYFTFNVTFPYIC